MTSGDAVQLLTVEETHNEEDGLMLHDQLVAYANAISGSLSQETRSGVWNEHSYARTRYGARSSSVRVLLAGGAQPHDDIVDVTTEPRALPPLPHDEVDEIPEAEDEGDEDWEERVAAYPPSATHARLALTTLHILRDMRLALLARNAGRVVRREEARAAARRLRVALAPLWAWPGALPLRPAAWLHAQLHAHLPAVYRLMYKDILSELRRMVPRLTDRLGAARLPPPADDPLGPDKVGKPRGAQEPGPWLAWIRCGCEHAEERWEQRLAALLHTRVLTPSAAAGPPERWAAGVLHAAKQGLADVIEEARGRAVIVGGAGAGAALAAALAVANAGVRGVLLVAPAPLTAEGARWLPDDTLHEVAAPTLLVAGGRPGALAGGPRRALGAAGTDAALRLPLRTRRRLRLPQQALDAALVEEMVRWAAETAEGGAGPAGGGEPAHAQVPALCALPAHGAGSNRAVEIVEGRVVTRVSGSTPLLLAPRRAPPAPAPAPAPAPPHSEPGLAAADIMQLPIVFADDDPPALAYSESNVTDKPVTVTSGGKRGSGAIRYTRVIVAKRGGRGARTLVSAGGGTRGAGPPGGGARGDGSPGAGLRGVGPPGGGARGMGTTGGGARHIVRRGRPARSS